MYGDFSRLTFNPTKSYTAVWSQQGRIQLDSDLNEQTAIMMDFMRQLAIDFIGPAGGHITRAGFKITPQDGDLALSPGHYYVAGIRCEVPEFDADGNPGRVTYNARKTADQPPIPKKPPYLVYLQLWERSVNWLQDPQLLEPALGPTSPDTTVRTEAVWSLAFDINPPTTANRKELDEAVDELFDDKNNPDPQPLLQARTADPDEAGSAGYLGLENQLYRIEIHCGNDDDANVVPTFKWSRDNGSAEFGIDEILVGEDGRTRVHLAGRALPGRPQLQIGDCVEIVDDSWEPFGTPGLLYTIQDVTPADHTVTLDGAIDPVPTPPARLRRWDSVPDQPDGSPTTVPDTSDDGWITIDNGIQIRFTGAEDAVFRRGDYWLIPARADTGDIYGPTATSPQGAPPHGPRRYYAPLALIRDGEPPEDLRSLFTQLAWPDVETAPS